MARLRWRDLGAGGLYVNGSREMQPPGTLRRAVGMHHLPAASLRRGQSPVVLAGGLYARRTAIGRDLVPAIADFGPGARLAITVAAVAAVVVGILTVLPASISSKFTVSFGIAAAVFLLPSLLPHMIPSGLTDAATSVVDFASKPAYKIADTVL